MIEAMYDFRSINWRYTLKVIKSSFLGRALWVWSRKKDRTQTKKKGSRRRKVEVGSKICFSRNEMKQRCPEFLKASEPRRKTFTKSN